MQAISLTTLIRVPATGLMARYYSSTQGRFTSVDPENAGANPDVPQSWNAYAYAGGNPVLFSDPDGREYLVCGPNGNDGKCTTVSDEEFWAERKELKKTGNTYTGSGDFFETGQIKNADGEVVATYAQISIDDRAQQYIFAIRGAVDPIPMATAQFFGISAVLGTGGGVLYYALAPVLAPTVTTLGLSGTGTSGAATGASLSGLSIQQLNTIIRGTQKQLLNKLFGQGMPGAQQALQSGQVPAGLTRETLMVAREIARRAIERGIDKGGVQAARLKIIEEALKKVK